ncbi:Hpt domain-containing protein [Dyadobacter sp. CY347]|uniref:Hpt domain-containing protein n=1 Tax=Dyadobacter sp. CY347 TaxID=2909336 RepID=UPI001F3EA666|nr:Hpt domain-containing protein [Dyadobacter sp. CY347]MCF2491461.1 Hpt domain-containing protein [Dyadobacter sp. CY347]
MDLSLLRSLMGDDEKLLNHFVTIFKAQAPKQIIMLSQLCEQDKWEDLSIAVHSLKTQFNYVGLSTFSERMRDMEKQIDLGETGSIKQQIQHFTDDFNEFWSIEFSTQ